MTHRRYIYAVRISAVKRPIEKYATTIAGDSLADLYRISPVFRKITFCRKLENTELSNSNFERQVWVTASPLRLHISAILPPLQPGSFGTLAARAHSFNNQLSHTPTLEHPARDLRTTSSSLPVIAIARQCFPVYLCPYPL